MLLDLRAPAPLVGVCLLGGPPRPRCYVFLISKMLSESTDYLLIFETPGILKGYLRREKSGLSRFLLPF